MFSPNRSAKPVPIPQRRRVRPPRGGVLFSLSGALTLLTGIAGVAVFGVMALENEIERPGPLQADKVVLIPKSTGTTDVSDILTREGVIDNPTLFELYSLINRAKASLKSTPDGGKGQLKAGEFLFRANSSIEQTIDTLMNGKPILHSVTIPEGLTSEQIVARLRENDVLTGAITEVPREGALMPDTYKFDRGTTRQQLVNLMLTAQRDALNKTWSRRAPDLPIRTPQELVILASIVEKETGRAEERSRVAGVFVNRLQRRMKLQSDPTIVYGIVGGKGTLGRGITRSEIERATPYNTYVIEGLPPTPIANPGRAALEAVANPMKTRELYFVADGTGGHAFAETLDQHNRNVARWRQIEQSRAVAGSGQTVDRVEMPPTRDNRTELDDIAAPTRYAGEGGERGAARGFDAVEGTARDPLRVQNWDLSSPKAVPSFGGEPSTEPRSAVKRQPARQPRREADGSPPPGLEGRYR